MNAPKGMACTDNGGVVCDGNGMCVAMHCMDGMKDADETDIDCGGSCSKCANGSHCGVSEDCTSGHCNGTNPGTCVECVAATDCTPTGNECIVNTCNNNTCGTQDLDQTHTLSTGQTTGDCQKKVCNGSGGTTSIDDPTDLPASTTVCLINPACTGTPLAPHLTPAATGTDCTSDNKPPNHVCGDTNNALIAGKCVQCNTIADCPVVDGGMLDCVNNICQ
jgi:hypothetical protein